MDHAFFDHDGLRLHYVTDGPPDAPLAVLLHGFPEDCLAWQAQLPALTAAGLRVAALDLRGAGESDMAATAPDYGMTRLVGDVVALLDHLGMPSAFVVGHDWGAAVAWNLALLAPARVRKLVALQVPHPDAFARTFQSLAQLRASWYAWLFQSEAADEVFAADRARLLADFAFGPPGRRLLPDAVVERYRDQFARSGRMTAGLNLYRANYRPDRLLRPARRARPVTVPTLYIYGDDDKAIMPDGADASGAYVSGEYHYARIQGASHWVQHERASEVNALLVEFLGAVSPY